MPNTEVRPLCYVYGLIQEIVFVVQPGEVILGAGPSAERLAVPHLLQVVQTAGDSAVAVGREGVEVHACPAVAAAVDLAPVPDWLAAPVHDAGRGGGIGIQEIHPCIHRVVAALPVAVAKRRLDVLQRGNRSSAAAELRLAVTVSGPDTGLHFLHSRGVRLRNEKLHRVFRRGTVDGSRFKYIDDDEMNLIAEYDSATVAAKAVGSNRTSIRNCANGKQKHAGGFVWRYLDQQSDQGK